jgi:hypothetical protein
MGVDVKHIIVVGYKVGNQQALKPVLPYYDETQDCFDPDGEYEEEIKEKYGVTVFTDGYSDEYGIIGKVLGISSSLRWDTGVFDNVIVVDDVSAIIQEVKQSLASSPFAPVCEGDPKLIIFSHYT